MGHSQLKIYLVIFFFFFTLIQKMCVSENQAIQSPVVQQVMLRHVKVVIQLLLKGGALIIGFSNLEVTDEFDEYSFMKMIVKKA